MKDDSLADMAQRAKDRAIRKGGELLAAVKAAKNQHDARADTGPSRKGAAADAGLSPWQAKEMLRGARLPFKTS